jgi:hypothetical protein
LHQEEGTIVNVSWSGPIYAQGIKKFGARFWREILEPYLRPTGRGRGSGEPHSAERRREGRGKHPIARGLCQAYGSHICQLKLS